jgi:hypothetical protein
MPRAAIDGNVGTGDVRAEATGTQLAQQLLFVALDRVCGRRPVLDAAHVQNGIAAELDLRPLEVRDLLRPQAMAIAHQDQEIISDLRCLA